MTSLIDTPRRQACVLPVDNSQWNSGKEGCTREIVLGFDDPQPGFSAGNHEIQASNPDHTVQRRTESRLDDTKTETDDNHQHPKKCVENYINARKDIAFYEV